jgi:hypothetical protein
MKNLRQAVFSIACLLLALSPRAFGWGADYDSAKDFGRPEGWPPRLVELAKLPSRVAGYFVNSDDYFAFKGDTAEFRNFLGVCVALADFAPTTVHIHKDKGSFQSLDQAKKPLSCDWQLDVINRHWRAGEANSEGQKYSFELHVWSEGAVDFGAIQVPPCVKIIKE